MTKEEYILLYEKCISGNCTEEEKKLLDAYSDDFSLDDTEWDANTLGNEDEIADRLYAQLYSARQQKSPARFSSLYKYAAAAVLFFILSAGLYSYFDNSPEHTVTESDLAKNTDIAPGRKKATLSLPDGTQMVLDQASNGVVSIQGNIKITKLKEGKVIYDSYNTTANDGTLLKEDFSSIKIPRGGEYELRLPDGTKVWLNSESSLKFPAVFSGRDRKVELTGEAYFEVAENKLVPFKVYANGTEIEVLGTHFNVNAYHKKVTTSLLEGSVRLKTSGKQSLLKPGQQGVTLADGSIAVSNANVNDAIAWKNGYFSYQDDSIYKIMEQAARWYDVEVEYRGDMTGKGFYGEVDRYDNISELLKNIELTGTVHFKIEGRRVIVMSK